MPALVGYNSVAASDFLMWKRSIAIAGNLRGPSSTAVQISSTNVAATNNIHSPIFLKDHPTGCEGLCSANIPIPRPRIIRSLIYLIFRWAGQESTNQSFIVQFSTTLSACSGNNFFTTKPAGGGNRLQRSK